MISREDLQSEFYNILDFNLAKIDPESKLFIYPEDTLCVLKDLDLNRDILDNCSIVTELVNYVSNRNKNQSVDKINNKLNIINFNYEELI